MVFLWQVFSKNDLLRPFRRLGVRTQPGNLHVEIVHVLCAEFDLAMSVPHEAEASWCRIHEKIRVLSCNCCVAIGGFVAAAFHVICPLRLEHVVSIMLCQRCERHDAEITLAAPLHRDVCLHAFLDRVIYFLLHRTTELRLRRTRFPLQRFQRRCCEHLCLCCFSDEDCVR